MDPTLAQLANAQDSRGLSKLAVLTEFINNIPPDKMQKVSKMSVTWETDPSGDNLPNLNVEFFN